MIICETYFLLTILLLDSLLTSLVESTYFNKCCVCKFESLQKDESRAQLAKPGKLAKKLTFD